MNFEPRTKPSFKLKVHTLWWKFTALFIRKSEMYKKKKALFNRNQHDQ